MKDQNLFGPIHATLPSHRKTERLVRRLAISRAAVVGGLVCLWCRVLLEAPDGCLEGWESDDLASVFCWEGDPETLRQALIATGWLEEANGVLFCHDWHDYFGHELNGRAREARRKRDARAAARVATSHESPEPSEDVRGQERTAADIDGQRPNVRHEKEKEKEKEKDPEGESGGADTQPSHPNPPTHPWPKNRAPKMGRGALGLDEAKHKPKTPEALLDRHRKTIDERFPRYSGGTGSVSALEKCTALFAAYSRVYDTDGPQVADAKLLGWLAQDHGRIRQEQQRRGDRELAEGERIIDGTIVPDISRLLR